MKATLQEKNSDSAYPGETIQGSLYGGKKLGLFLIGFDKTTLSILFGQWDSSVFFSLAGRK